jgi:hypothetical protein
LLREFLYEYLDKYDANLWKHYGFCPRDQIHLHTTKLIWNLFGKYTREGTLHMNEYVDSMGWFRDPTAFSHFYTMSLSIGGWRWENVFFAQDFNISYDLYRLMRFESLDISNSLVRIILHSYVTGSEPCLRIKSSASKGGLSTSLSWISATQCL